MQEVEGAPNKADEDACKKLKVQKFQAISSLIDDVVKAIPTMGEDIQAEFVNGDKNGSGSLGYEVCC